MKTLPKILICGLLVAVAAIGHVNRLRAADGAMAGGDLANSVVLRGPDMVAFNLDAARGQTEAWRLSFEDPVPLPDKNQVAGEIAIRRYVRSNHTVSDHRRLSTKSLAVGTLSEIRNDREPAGAVAQLLHASRPWESDLSGRTPFGRTAEARGPAAGDVLDHPSSEMELTEMEQAAAGEMYDPTGEGSGGFSSEMPDEQSELLLPSADPFSLLGELNAFDWLVISTVLLLAAMRMGLWSYLNQAVFLGTANWQGVTVAAGSHHPRRRKRHSSRSSPWARRSSRRRSAWSPYGASPSRRRSRRQNYSRRRATAKSRSREFTGSARPREQRGLGGREYVVADVVYTNNRPVARSGKAPTGGLLTYLNE